MGLPKRLSTRIIAAYLLMACLFGKDLHANLDPEESLHPRGFVKTNEEISEAIKGAAKDVDLSLTGKKLVDTENRTKITVRNETNWPSGGPFSYQPHLDIQLHLPNLEKKWSLKFTTYDQDQENLGVNSSRVKTTTSRTSYAGSFGLVQKLENIEFQFEPRLEYRNGLQVSTYTRFLSTGDFGFGKFHPQLQLFAKADQGIGEFVSLDTDLYYKSFTFTLINEEEYQDQANTLSTNNGGALGCDYSKYVSQNIALLYQLTNRPNLQLNTYTISTTLTHKVLRNVLHYIIQPYYLFPSSTGFAGNPGLNLELDLIF